MLEAGRELDALIAERVMGWRRLTYFEHYGPKFHDNPRSRAQLTRNWHDSTGKAVAAAEDTHEMYEPGGEDEWSPSTVIGDAWQVLEYLKQRGWRWGCYQREDGWLFEARHGSGAEWLSVQDAGATAPLAICRVALTISRSADESDAASACDQA